MTTFLQTRPRPPLDSFVETLWLQNPSSLEGRYATESAEPAAPRELERIIPTGTVEIVIHLSEPEIRLWDPDDLASHQLFSGAIIAGAHSEIFVIDTHEQEHVIGVHFRPGGAYPFLGVDVHELADQHVNLEEVWGTAATRLRERLLGESSPRHQFEILEDALLDHVFRPLEHHAAVASSLERLSHNRRVEPVQQLANDAGLSARRFLQLFQREVGLSPKRFCRVLRFQRALDRVSACDRRDALDWIGIALANGYADQSHFNRDFRAFTGVTPSEYVAAHSGHRNHLPVLPS
jgi:AraC-like DNA-binding protein